MIRVPHDNNVSYKACTTQGCSKRVEEKPGGGYFCNVHQDIPHCDERYILSVMAADHSGYSYLSAFNDVALVLLDNIPASKLPNKKEVPTAYDAVFNEAAFKMYRFTIRAKMETYQSEQRLKNTVIHAERVNFLDESKRLLQEIAAFN